MNELTKHLKRWKRQNKRLLVLQWFFTVVLALFLLLNIYQQHWGWAIFDLVFIMVGLVNIRSMNRTRQKISDLLKQKQLP